MDRPKIGITRIDKLRQTLYSKAFVHFVGKPLREAEEFSELCRLLKKVMPGVPYNAILETVRPHINEAIPVGVAVKLAWLMAGNLETLQSGAAARPWVGQHSEEWMAVEIRSLSRVLRYANIVSECVFRILSGTGSGLTVTRYLSAGAIKHIARKIGFSAANGRYPYRHTLDMTYLRFYGKFEQSCVRDGIPGFKEVECPDSLCKWNRDNFLAVRCRHKAGCPRGYTHPCTKCAIGRNECPFAVRPLSYTLGFCDKCMNADALFDPAAPATTVCAQCLSHQRCLVDIAKR